MTTRNSAARKANQKERAAIAAVARGEINPVEAASLVNVNARTMQRWIKAANINPKLARARHLELVAWQLFSGKRKPKDDKREEASMHWELWLERTHK